MCDFGHRLIKRPPHFLQAFGRNARRTKGLIDADTYPSNNGVVTRDSKSNPSQLFIWRRRNGKTIWVPIQLGSVRFDPSDDAAVDDRGRIVVSRESGAKYVISRS